jgi:hypothetical protein
MAHIKIKGCGYCSKSRGCKIKKDFRDLASTNERYTEVKSNIHQIIPTYQRLNEFELICPFGDRKLNEGDKISFTLGIQRYIKTTLWDCDNDCDYCNNDNCDNGVVTFVNTRYKEYIKVAGTIVNLMRNDKWIISISEDEYHRIAKLCNTSDIKFFEEISEKLDPGQEFYMVFVSKEKYIEKV